MKKDLKIELSGILRHTHTNRLRSELWVLNTWEHNHSLKKSSWFWDNNGNADERAKKESWYTFEDDLTIGRYTLHYYSKCSMSRQNVYWSDGLSLKDYDDVNVTFGDISFLRQEIEEILKKRDHKPQDGAA